MRSILAVLAAVVLGCGQPHITATTASEEKGGRHAESKIWITQPAAGKEFGPGETFECIGKFTVERSHRQLSRPKISILSGKQMVDQFQGEPGEPGPEGEIPFEAKLRCPKKPGKYSLRVTMTVGQPRDPKVKPLQESVIESKPLDIVVKEAVKK
jgi:hypothetical protein